MTASPAPNPEALGPRASSQRLFSSSFRSGAIRVQALDGVSSGPLQFHTAQERADWLRAVSANISDLMLQNVSVEMVPCPCVCFSVHGNSNDSLLFKINPKTVGHNVKQKNVLVKKAFIWRIIALQYCDGFCRTST